MNRRQRDNIARLLNQLDNSNKNLQIDFEQDHKHWSRIGELLKSMIKDTERLSAYLQQAKESTIIHIERQKGEKKLK